MLTYCEPCPVYRNATFGAGPRPRKTPWARSIFHIAGLSVDSAFNAFAEPLYTRPRSREEELEFLHRQGPVVPSLVEQLAARRAEFCATLFFTYLYYPTYWGLLAAPERSVLVPTTHDEPPLRFGIYDELFGCLLRIYKNNRGMFHRLNQDSS